MRELVKGVLALVTIAAVVAAGVAWMDDRPDQTTLYFRIGAPIVALAALAVFYRIHFRRDIAPDFLRRNCGRAYFDRGGFCFTFFARRENEICFFEVFFQNRYERPCLARIALRPASGFFGRRKIETIQYDIECDAAAFGVARVPVPIPAHLQGKRQRFEVGASVQYPTGRGRMLRFRDGLTIRANSNFSNAFGTALALAGALSGQVVLSKPATWKIDLPIGVADTISDNLKPEIRTLWRLGDMPIKSDIDAEVRT